MRRLHVHGYKSSIHRLRVSFYWYDEEHFGVDVSWGSAGADPVWMVAWWPVRIHPRLDRRLRSREARRRRRERARELEGASRN